MGGGPFERRISKAITVNLIFPNGCGDSMR